MQNIKFSTGYKLIKMRSFLWLLWIQKIYITIVRKPIRKSYAVEEEKTLEKISPFVSGGSWRKGELFSKFGARWNIDQKPMFCGGKDSGKRQDSAEFLTLKLQVISTLRKHLESTATFLPPLFTWGKGVAACRDCWAGYGWRLVLMLPMRGPSTILVLAPLVTVWSSYLVIWLLHPPTLWRPSYCIPLHALDPSDTVSILLPSTLLSYPAFP